MLADLDAFGPEGGAQHLYRPVRFGLAAHEDIHRCVTMFGPAMDADMRFGQHRDAGHAVVLGKMMQVNMQQRRARRIDAVAQHAFDKRHIVEPFRAPHIDDQMRAGKPDPILFDKIIVGRDSGGGRPCRYSAWMM